MSKGKVYPELVAALATFMQRNGLTTYKLHQELVRNPDRYDTPEAFSLTSVANAVAGKPVTRRSMEVLRGFLRGHDPALMPTPVRDTDPDIARFLFVRDEDVAKYGRLLEGDFQTFAKSTTAEGYVRLGHVAFENDAARRRIRMTETQHRPEIDGHHTTTVKWTGSVAPKSEFLFALLRTVQDLEDATPMWYQLRPLLREPASGRIISLKATAMHFEPERSCTMFPSVFLVRTPLPDIRLDFVPTHDVQNAAVRLALALGPRLVSTRRTAPRREEVDTGSQPG